MSQAEEKQQQPTQQQAVQQQQHSTQQQQPAPAQAAVAPNGHAKATVPKLAPAPVPQQTPWKAPVIDPAEARANLEAVDAAHSQRHSKNAAVQRAREANKQVAASVPSAAAGSPTQGPASAGLAPKRATTGKEKWIPFTPVIPPSSSGTSSTGSSTRSRQNKRQSASFRQRRTGNSQGDRSGNSTGSNNSGSNNNSDKRKLGSQTQANGGRNNGAGHQRSVPRAAANSRSDRPQQAEQGSNSSSLRGSQEPPVTGVEKLQVNDAAEGDAINSEDGLASSSFNAQSNGSSLAGSNPNSQNRNMHDRRTQQHTRQNFVPRNQNGSRKPRDNMRFGGPNKMPYYPGGYMASQMGFIPMQAMQMSAAPVPAVVPAVSTQKDLQMAYLVGQVDYYFSVENLCKDTFLRKNMNDEGLVPINVIANFARVKILTTDLSLVAEACSQAPNIEVIGSKARAAINHHLWVFPEANRLPPGLDNGLESAQANPIPPFSSESSASEPKFHVEQAVPFIPRGASESSN